MFTGLQRATAAVAVTTGREASAARSTAGRMRTLYLDANGVGWRIVAIDTLLRGIFRYSDGDLPPMPLRRVRPVAALFRQLRDVNDALSYAVDWREAIAGSPELDVERCNINNLVHFGSCLRRLREYDLIIVSHAAAGDDMSLLLRVVAQFDRRRAPIVVFIGNEYDLLADKIRFIRETGAEFVCTQLPFEAGRYLYGEATGAQIVEMPHALNPERFHPLSSGSRDVDIGFAGDVYWAFIGDRERTDVIEWFEQNCEVRGLRCDIRKARLPREEWNLFLNRCKALIGAESGTYYLNDRGRVLDEARRYNLHVKRDAGFQEIFDKFYRGLPREISGKCISSRHFEPIGTKTCQILLEGDYNGILVPDEHYIAIKKDFTNIDNAIERFRDGEYRKRIADRAYDLVMAGHTYRHRVATLLSAVGSTVHA
jgi:glycosyl transferase family 1